MFRKKAVFFTSLIILSSYFAGTKVLGASYVASGANDLPGIISALSSSPDASNSIQITIDQVVGGTLVPIAKSVNIYGLSAATTIDLNGFGKLQFETPGNIYNISDLKIMGGVGPSNAGAAMVASGVTLNIDNATFENNEANSYGGGAIYNSGTLNIVSMNGDISFNENVAFSGGAIQDVGTTTVSADGGNITFYKNAGAIGGAIINNTGTTSVKADNSGNLKFNENSASINGGAFYNYLNTTTNITADNSAIVTFFKNTASNGGAIYNVTSATNIKALNDGKIVFDQNSAPNGAVIYDDQNSTIEITADGGDIEFKNNKAADSGGVIYSNNSTVNVTASNDGTVTFDSNSSNSSLDYTHGGGVIYNSGTGVVNLEADGGDIVFNKNTAGNAGVIHNNGGTVNVTSTDGNIKFTNNKVTNVVGVLYNLGASSRLNIKAKGGEILFKGNEGKGAGGAIHNNAGLVTIEADGGDITFEQNTGSNGAIHNSTTAAAVMNITSTDGTILFNGNIATGTGGAIYNTGTLNLTSLDKIVFSSNTATTAQGGAIYNVTKAVIKADGGEISFSKNSAHLGGALHNASGTIDLLADNGIIDFSENSANGGGAIFNYSAITATSEDKGEINFIKNTAVSDGGVVYNTGTIDFSADDSKILFDKNTSGGNGGAFLNYGALDFTAENGSDITFSGNSASIRGGAIYTINNVNLESDSISTITFSENSAPDGGAIYNTATLTVDGVTFDGNTASNFGGAIYNSGTATISNSTFENNYAGGGSGSAIYNATGGTLTLAGGNVFDGNSAPLGITNTGGTIYNIGTLTISGINEFKNNSARNGAAITNWGGTTTINAGSTFTNNDGSNAGALFITGGTINLDSTGGTIDFSGNTRNSGKNDLTFNTASGNVNINGTGTVNMDGGVSTINANGGTLSKNGSGVFNLLAGSINNLWRGTFNQNAGTTNVASSFFGGTTNANGGELNFVDGSTNLADTATVDVGASGVVNLKHTTGKTFTIQSGVQGSSATGQINKTGAGNLTIEGITTAFKGIFKQTAGKTTVTSDGRFFGGTNNVEAGTLQVTGDTSEYTVNLGSASTSAQLIHYVRDNSLNTIANTAIKFVTGSTGNSILFDKDSGVTGSAQYDLSTKLENGFTNTVTFDNSNVLLSAGNYEGLTKYIFNNSVLDITGSAIHDTIFDYFEATDSKLSFNLSFDVVSGVVQATSDTLTVTHPVSGQTIGIGTIGLKNDQDNGLGDTYTVEVLTGLTFNALSDTATIATTAYEYSVGVLTSDRTKLELTVLKESDEHSLYNMNDLGGERGFNFSYFEDEPEIYYIGESLGTTKAGDFAVTGYDSDPTHNIISGLIKGGGGAKGSFFKVANVTDLLIQNVTIQDASDINGSVVYQDKTGSSVIINNSIFKNNYSSERGGAINSHAGTMDINNSQFTNNIAGIDGGAVINYTGGTMTLAGDTFDGNSANYGGALYSHSNATTILNSGNTFTNNHANSNGGAIYNWGSVAINGSNTFTDNSAAGMGGAIFNAATGTLTLNSTAGNIVFTDNKANGVANDINNGGGVINVSGTAGKVQINGGISGTGTIAKTGAGVFELNGDSSNYTGAFNQSAGLTKIGGKFFNSIASITAGVVDLVTGGSLSASSVLKMHENATFTISSDSPSLTVLSSQISANAGTYGDVYKTGSATLTLSGDFSSYEGDFVNQKGKTVVGSTSKLFGGLNAVIGGEIQVTGHDLNYTTIGVGSTLTTEGLFTHLADATSAIEIDGAKVNFIANAEDSNMVFKADSSLGAKANYKLKNDITNTLSNTITFVDSNVTLGANTFTSATNYALTDSTLDLRNAANELTTFDDIELDNAKLSFDVSFDVSGATTSLGSDTLTFTAPAAARKIGIDQIAVIADSDNGTKTSLSKQVLTGLEFEGTSETPYVSSEIYKYAVGYDSSDARFLTLKAIGFANEYSLEKMNVKSGTRAFDFSVYDTTSNPSAVIYKNAASLSNMAAGTFNVLGRDAEPSLSVISGILHGTSTKGSLFKMTNATTLNVKNLTIQDASITGDGSVLNLVNASATANFDNVVIKNNQSSTHGGAVRNTSGGTFSATDSTFSGNQTTSGNGGAINSSKNITLSGDTFSGNSAANWGGAIHSATTPSSATITSTGFTGNSATQGGAISNEGTMTINGGTTFTNNTASTANGGGAIFNRSGSLTLNSTTGNITFSGNKAAGLNNDINNTTALNINGTANTVSFGGGISGNSTITKSGAGVLALEAGSVNSNFTGTFDQNAGTTNVASSFFGGTSNINGGSLNFNNGSSLIAAAIVNLASGTNTYFNQTSPNTFDLAGQIRGTGNLTKTSTGVLNLSGDNSLYTGTYTQSGGITNVAGTFFGGTSNINTGTLNLNNGTVLSNSSVVNLASGTTTNLTQSGANSLTVNGQIRGTGALNKTGTGKLSLNGNNSQYTGTFTQTVGTTRLEENAQMFGGGASKNLVNGGVFEAVINSDAGQNVPITLDGGELKYLSNTTNRINVNNANISNVVLAQNGANITWDSYTASKAKYNLVEDIKDGSLANIIFKNSDVTFGASTYDNDATYKFVDSILDLSNGGTPKTVTFTDMEVTNSTLNIETRFKRDTVTDQTELVSSLLVNEGSEQTIALGLISMYGEANDDGHSDSYTVTVLDGLKFAAAKHVEYATNSHRYSVDTTSDLTGLDFNFKEHTGAHSLYDLNAMGGDRVFSFDWYDNPNILRTYNIDEELSETLAGTMTLVGANGGPTKNVVSGVIVDSTGTPTGDPNGSFFKLNNETELVIEGVTIQNALADGINDDGNGSVVNVNNADATVSLKNVIIKNNEATLNGGAIYNNAGEVTIYSGLFDSNTADGLGGVIYNNDILNLTADGGNAIAFTNNADGNGANDIYNTSDGVININGTGKVNIEGGISGDGGEVNISNGTVNFKTSATLSGNEVTQTGGILNWAGTKLSDASLSVEGGTLVVKNSFTLNFNNADDRILEDAALYIETGATLNNALGSVILDGNTDTLLGSLINASTVEMKNYSYDFTTGTASFSQTASTGVLNLTGTSTIKSGTKFTLTDGILNVGNAASGGAKFIAGTGSTIGETLTINVFENNSFVVNGGTVSLDSGDTLEGLLGLAIGTLNLNDVTNKGVFKSADGNLNLTAGNLDLGIDSIIAKATKVDLATGTSLNIDTGAEVTLDSLDIWKGDVNVTGGRLILEGFTNSIGDTDVNKLTQNGGILTLTGGSSFVLGNNVSLTDPNVEIYNSTFTIPQGTGFTTFADLTMNNGTLNTMNDEITKYNINTLNVGPGTSNFVIDIQGDPFDYDTFNIGNIVGNGKINISSFKILGAPTSKVIDLHIFQATDYGNVKFTETAGVIHSGIYDYHLIPGAGGMYTLSRAWDHTSINKQTYRGQVATLAAYNHQLLINNMIFDHIYLDSNDMNQMVNRPNQYAATGSTFAPYQFTNKDGSIWSKSYAAFEKLYFTHDIEVENNVYGSLIGVDLPVMKLKRGWKFVPTGYVGYNGGHQNYNQVSIYQNGGQGGLMGTFTKSDFIGSILAYAGGYNNEMQVAGVTDRTGNWFAGTAAKAAYNFHSTRNLIIQPNALISYNIFGKQDWYTGFGEISMNSGYMNGINVAPGLNLIYGRETWSVYGSVLYMYNINDSISGNASTVHLPSISMRHGYIEYGVGAIKNFTNRFSSYAQVAIRNGGRNGVGFQLGFNWKF